MFEMLDHDESERKYIPTYLTPFHVATTTDMSVDHLPSLTYREAMTVVPEPVKPVEPLEWKCEYCGQVNVLAECRACGAPKPMAGQMTKDEILEAITDETAKAARKFANTLVASRIPPEAIEPATDGDNALVFYFLLVMFFCTMIAIVGAYLIAKVLL